MSESNKGRNSIKKVLSITRMIWMFLTFFSYFFITNPNSQTILTRGKIKI